MNAQELQKILNQPKSIDASTALELMHLCKEFPYFSWPFAALTAYQLEKNDFRLENTLHQTSLRIDDREWLQDYLFKPASSDQKPADSDQQTADNQLSPVSDKLTASSVEPVAEAEKLTEESEILTAENIEAINPSLLPLEEDEIEIESDANENFESLPIEETQVIENPFKPIKLATPVYNLEDLYPVPEETEEPKKVASSDFYAWLNAGNHQKNAIVNKPLERKEDLIEKFLKTKPSISRPKQEFYTPEKAMKKSEVLSNKIVTETLANIYNKQGNFEKAIEAYEQLSLKFPEKKPYFANLINQIKIENNLS